MKKSPTQRTLEWCRKHNTFGIVDKVEYWNSFARVRKDLFGIIDVVEVDGETTYGIQCTTKKNMNARKKKILESEALPYLLKAGWRVEIWGWYKKKNKWLFDTERF